MLRLSTTSTCEWSDRDTMRENTKGRYFGGQVRCIIFGGKDGVGRDFLTFGPMECFGSKYQDAEQCLRHKYVGLSVILWKWDNFLHM